ncbi:MAG: hypothetical protein HY658_05540 [Actinobacteria bacterium]|nr:hypothetical protein [Actinomycetota bacterium]
MSEPIVFVTTMQIHEGKLEQFKEGSQKAMAWAEANGPQLMQGVYIDEEEMRAHGFQLHRDSESILSWWQVGDPHIQDVMQHITVTRVDIYGRPSDAVMEGMRRLSGTGATLTVTPRLTGFSRFQGGA